MVIMAWRPSQTRRSCTITPRLFKVAQREMAILMQRSSFAMSSQPRNFSFRSQVKQLQRQKENLEDRLNSNEIESRKLSRQNDDLRAKVDVLERDKKSAEARIEKVKEDSEAKLLKLREEKDTLEDR